jgi:parallel beta-helix repeat protein
MKHAFRFLRLATLGALGLTSGAVLAQGTDIEALGNIAHAPTADGVVRINRPATAYETSGEVRYFDPEGSNTNDGKGSGPDRAWKSLTSDTFDGNGKLVTKGTISLVPAGATLVFAAGRYACGDIKINKALTLQPAANAEVWLVGTKRVTSWQRVGTTNVWWAPCTVFKKVSETGVEQGKSVDPDHPEADLVEQVFVNDKPLAQVLPLANAASLAADRFFVDRGTRRVYVHLSGANANPETQNVEVTAYENGLALEAPNLPSSQRIIVRGLGFRNYAGRGLNSSSGVKNLQLENCTFAYNSTDGANLNGNVDNVRVNRNTFAYNGRIGLRFGGPGRAAQQIVDIVAEHNVCSYNNQMLFKANYSAGGLKSVGLDGLLIRHNLFENNLANGLWLDEGTERAKVLSNISRGNDGIGIFFEISRGALIAGNTCYDNNSGIQISESSGVALLHNTLLGNTQNIIVTEGGRSPDRTKGQEGLLLDRGITQDVYGLIIRNNVLADGKFNLNIGPNVGDNDFAAVNNNLYIRSTAGAVTRQVKRNNSTALTVSYDKLADFQSRTPFEDNGDEEVGKTLDAYFAQPSGAVNQRAHHLQPCNGWTLPTSYVIPADGLTITAAQGGAQAFRVTAAELRAALGVPTGALTVGAKQTLATCGTTKQDQSITFDVADLTVTASSSVTLDATASSGLNVAYAIEGPHTRSGNTLTFTEAGTVTVTANQQGNNDYNAASAVTRTFTVTATVASAPVAAGTYRLLARHSGKALDVRSASTAEGADVLQWSANGKEHQQWQVQPTGGGYYLLVAKHSGKALALDLDAATNGGHTDPTNDGVRVEQAGSDQYDRRLWKIQATTNGYYQLINKRSGKVLDVSGASTADGAAVQSRAYTGGNSQQWKLEAVTSSVASATTSASAPTPTVAAVVAANEPVPLGEAASLSVFPNPNYGDATLELKAKEAQRAHVYIYSGHSGRQLVGLFSVRVQPGTTLFHLPAHLPSNTTYFIKTSLDGQPVHFKVEVR